MERQEANKVQKNSAKANHVQNESARPSSAAHPLLQLQRSIGNQAVQRLIDSRYIQAKLQVSTPEDPFEQEADRVADTVMRMAEPGTTNNDIGRIQSNSTAPRITRLVQREAVKPLEEKEEDVPFKPMVQRVPLAVREDDDEKKVAAKLDTIPTPQEEEEDKPDETNLGLRTLQRKTTEDEEKEEAPPIQRQMEDEDQEAGDTRKLVQTKGAQTPTPTVTTPVAANINALNGGGSPLPDSTRAFFEPRFGTDLGNVRVHTDQRAAETARSVSARAFTVGRNIAFNSGQYAPHSQQGRQLLAHELTHTIQQGATNSSYSASTPGHAATDVSTSARYQPSTSSVVQRDPLFTPTFGGDAGDLMLENLNADIKLRVNVKNAKAAPSGTSMVWSWGATAVEGVQQGDISPATGPNATFNAKAIKPTPEKANDKMAANVEVTEPDQAATLYPVKPPLRVAVLEPEYKIEQKVVPGAKGGGSPTALQPSDILEFRITIDHVDKPRDFYGDAYQQGVLPQNEGLYLGKLGGVAITDDTPFQIRPYRWEGNTLVHSVYCHHAGKGTFKLDFTAPGTKKVSKEFALKSETSLPFFLARCGAATNRHRALVATFDAYIHEGFLNYKAGYEAAEAAIKEYAEEQKLTREILLGILFAGLGGAAGGYVGGLVKFNADQTWYASMAKSALREAEIGAISDAPKDIAKYTVRLGRKLFEGGGGGAPTPDDATPEVGGGGGKSGMPGSPDPLNWYAAFEAAKSKEEAKIATTIELWQTKTIDAISRGSTATVDFDPINAVTDITKLDGKDITQLGTPPSAAAYEKNMWEAWIEKYAFTLRAKIGCGQWGYRVQDNVGKTLREEMDRVANVLAKKGIDASWLTDALKEAERIASEKAAASQRLF